MSDSRRLTRERKLAQTVRRAPLRLRRPSRRQVKMQLAAERLAPAAAAPQGDER